MICRRLREFTVVAVAGVIATGCSTLPNGRGWGEDVTFLPEPRRVSHAAWDGASAPGTWLPIAAALLLQLDDMDSRLQGWAADHTPLFSSHDAASRWSDGLRSFTSATYALSTLATPSGNEPRDWTVNKVRGAMVGLGARVATRRVVSLLKSETDRRRPDGRDDRSFPSGHASDAMLYATFSAHNIDHVRVPATMRSVARGTVLLAAVSCGWARIEGRHHYPSDVLASFALARFLGRFMSESLGLPTSASLGGAVAPKAGGASLRLDVAF